MRTFLFLVLISGWITTATVLADQQPGITLKWETANLGSKRPIIPNSGVSQDISSIVVWTIFSTSSDKVSLWHVNASDGKVTNYSIPTGTVIYSDGMTM